MLCWMDARLESRYLSNNYTTRNLSEDIIKLKTCLKILIFSSYVKSADPQVSRLRSIVCTQLTVFIIVSLISV
jgi:hypothetical protein